MAGRFQSSFGVRKPVVDDFRSLHVQRPANMGLPQSVRLHESVAQLSPMHKRAHLDSVCTSPSKRQKRRCRSSSPTNRNSCFDTELHLRHPVASYRRTFDGCREMCRILSKAASPSSEGSLNDPVGIDLMTGESHEQSQGNSSVAADAFGSNGAETLAGDLKVDDAEADASR